MKNGKTNNNSEGYQIIAVNIKYGKELRRYNSRPEITTLDVPSSITSIKDKSKFEDAIETFSYNTLTKRYGAEVNFCQIFIP